MAETMVMLWRQVDTGKLLEDENLDEAQQAKLEKKFAKLGRVETNGNPPPRKSLLRLIYVAFK